MQDVMLKYGRLSVSLLLLTCSLIVMIKYPGGVARNSSSALTPQQERLLAANSTYAIYLERFAPCDDCFSQVKMILKIEDKIRRLVGVLEINEGFRQVPPRDLKASIIGRRALIAGELTHGDKIMVFRLEPPFPIETAILCFRPSISIDGSKVAYVNHMVRFDDRTHTIVLSVLSLHNSSLTSHVVYPPENVARRDPKPFVQNPALRRVLISPLVWNEDGTKIVFIERLGDKNEIHLVEVDMSAGMDAVISYKSEIEIASLVKRALADSPPHLLFFVENIKWVGAQKVEMYLQNEDYWKTAKITLALPSRTKASRQKAIK